LNTQDAEAHRILTEAQRVCEEQGSGVTITLVGTIGDQFVIIFNVASLHNKGPAERDVSINEIASKLQGINGVARVCYEVLPDMKRSH
jgi:hypothetical protein